MEIKEKIEILINESKTVNKFSHLNVIFRLNDIRDSVNQYKRLVKSEKKYQIDYKDIIFNRTLRRREIEDDIIRDIVFLDKFAKNNNFEMLYGKFTDIELKYTDFALENNYKRKDILECSLEISKVI